ncbi:MAG: hypothetical protein LBC88_10255, partial [Spirochaetaceae bacterium]|nr:hypothetical protein [Spirochaetaceae bacterium]
MAYSYSNNIVRSRPSGARNFMHGGGGALILGICAALLFAACLPPLGFYPEKANSGLFNFLGEFPAHPADPNEGDSYFNNQDGYTYYFNGQNWEILSAGVGQNPVFLPKLDAAVAAATPWSISHTGTWTDAQGNPQTGPVTRT